MSVNNTHNSSDNSDPARPLSSKKESRVALLWQSNLQHCRASAIELSRLILKVQHTSTVICLIQEPYLVKGKLPYLNETKCKSFVPCRNARTAIICSQELNAWYAPSLSDRDTTTIILKDKAMGEIVISSMYFDILLGMPEKLEKLSKETKPLVICADTNAHSVLWGCEESNPRGEMIEEFIIQNDFLILNVGNNPTYVSRGAETIIDVTFTKNTTDEMIQNWRVDRKTLLSDHRLIQMEITISRNVIKYSWNLNRGDPLKFQREMEDAGGQSPVWSKRVIDIVVKSLINDITKSLNRCYPLTKGPANCRKTSKWWNKELDHLRKKTKQSEREAYRAKRNAPFSSLFQDKWNNYVLNKKQYSKEIRRAKRKAWQKYTSDINTPQGIASLNSIVNREDTNSSLGLLQQRIADVDCDLAPEGTVKLLLDTHFPGSTELKGGVQVVVDDDGATVTEEELATNGEVAFITNSKVKKAIDSFKPLKAPGPDGIKAKVLQWLGPKQIQRLTSLYRAIVFFAYTPLRWRSSRVIFIPKPGKKDYSIPKAFRPISLMPTLFKVLERIVLWEIEENVLSVNPVSSHQHGFRRGSSTESALSVMTSEVEHALLNRQQALAVFLDIEGAFDNVAYTSIEAGMRRHHFPRLIREWYMDYLTNRSITTDLLGVKVVRRLTKGVPQGGVISPLAWNLVYDPLLEIINTKPAKGIGLADDGSLIVKGLDPAVMADLIQPILDKAYNWGQKNGLKFSAKKTQAILFSRKRKKGNVVLTLGGQVIDQVKEVKYLGVTLDDRLTWTPHIRGKIKACTRRLMQIKNAVGKIWGPSPWAMLMGYKSLIIPSISYGCLTWSRGCSTSSARKGLTRLNRLLCLSLGPMGRSIPTAGLEVLLNIMPLDLVIDELGLNSYTRLRHVITPRWGVIGDKSLGHLHRWDKMAEGTPLHNLVIDSCPGKWHWNPEYKVETIEEGNVEDSKECQNEPVIECFTDDISSETKSEWRCRIKDFKGAIYEAKGDFPAYVTSTQVHTHAIKEACQFIERSMPPHTDVKVNVTNQITFNRLSDDTVLHKTVDETVQALEALCKSRNVTLRAKKTHVIQEEAEVILLHMAPREATLPIAKSSFKRGTRLLCQNMWADRWSALKQCRQTKLWVPDIGDPGSCAKRSKQLLQLEREKLGLTLQFLTGHNRLRRHLSLSDKSVDATCRFCLEDEETAWHLVAECPALCKPRQDIFHVQGRISSSPEWSPKQITTFIGLLSDHIGVE